MTYASKKPKLAVFDVEGVLIPKNRLFFDVAKSLSTLSLIRVLYYGVLYEIGVLPLRQVLTKIFGVMRGIPLKTLEEKLRKLPLMPNAAEVFGALHAEGYKTALISSGLPTSLVEEIAGLVGADYAVGIEIGVADGKLTGEVWGDVIERNGKFLVLKELMESEGVSPADVAVVADDRNNASIFQPNMLKIGYDPDFVIRTKADFVVTGGLGKVLCVIRHEPKTNSLSKNDVLRELIHMSGFFIPLLSIYFGRLPVAAFTSVILAIYTASELSRLKGKNMPFFSQITRHAASKSELCQFAFAPIYFGVGILLTLLLPIPDPVCYAAIAIFTLGDSAASLVGGRLSKRATRFNRTKTLEGTAAGFAFGALGAAVFVSPLAALAGAAVGMLVEFLPLPVNDNVLIPLSAGLVLTFLV